MFDEPDTREEHPVLCILRGHYKSVVQGRIKGTPKLYDWLIGLLAWLDDEVCDMQFEEKLRARTGATLLLRMLTQHPSWIAEVNSSRAALATVEREKVLVDPGEQVFDNSLSATEDAMIGLLDIRRDADKMVKRFGITYETAILSIVDPD